MERARQITIESPVRLNLIAWPDPVVEAHGHRPGSPYIHLVYAGRLGPSTLLCWEHLARIATVRGAATIDVVDLAVTLGLGEGLQRGAPISRTLARMVAFGAAKRTGDTLAVRLALPDLPEHQARRLSYSARQAHEHLAYFHQGRKR